MDEMKRINLIEEVKEKITEYQKILLDGRK